jgi:CheY-like chemotaxis protein
MDTISKPFSRSNRLPDCPTQLPSPDNERRLSDLLRDRKGRGTCPSPTGYRTSLSAYRPERPQVLEAARLRLPQFILLDICRFWITGYEVARQLREEEWGKDR